MQTVILENLLFSVNFDEIFMSINLWGGPITVEHLKYSNIFPHKFIEVNLSKLMNSNQIFRIDFICIHYHLCEISC